jgi:HipA-like protein
VADELAVWLYGSRVATIDSERRRPRLTYTDEARRLYAPGTPLLSLSLPIRAERYSQGIVRPFLDGLPLKASRDASSPERPELIPTTPTD